MSCGVALVDASTFGTDWMSLAAAGITRGGGRRTTTEAVAETAARAVPELLAKQVIGVPPAPRPPDPGDDVVVPRRPPSPPSSGRGRSTRYTRSCCGCRSRSPFRTRRPSTSSRPRLRRCPTTPSSSRSLSSQGSSRRRFGCALRSTSKRGNGAVWTTTQYSHRRPIVLLSVKTTMTSLIPA